MRRELNQRQSKIIPRRATQRRRGFHKIKNLTKEKRMRKLLLIATFGLALAMLSRAALSNYKTFTATNTVLKPAQINIPADPNSEIRVVDVSWFSDTNNAALVFTTGSTPFTQTITNMATSSVTNQISGTNGLSPNCLAILQHNGVCYTNTITAWNQSTNFGPYMGTNIVLATGGWGVIASPGDSIYVMGQSTATRYVGATTNATDGDAIYVGNYGRPVTVLLSPVSAFNSLNVSVHYDSN